MTSFSSLEVYHDQVPRSAAMNMALDEVLWVTSTVPTLRFYQWDHPALSFGYFGQYAEVACYRDKWELVRRCTGGGVVFHGKDLTYALIIPVGFLHESSPVSIYGIVHRAIKVALEKTGLAATLVEQLDRRHSLVRNAPAASDQSTNGIARTATTIDSCFANPVVSDVLVNGRKVAGAAQRRSRRGLLQQGSIQNVELPVDFREKFTRALCPNPVTGHISNDLTAQAKVLAGQKYTDRTWLERR